MIFLIQHSTSELIFFTEMYLSKSPSLSRFSSETKHHLVLTFSRQNYFQKMLSPHLHTISVDKTRSARAIWCFLTDLILHALVVTLLCVVNCCPLAMTARHYVTEDKNSLGFSSLGRINITSRYVTCCYGDGLTVLFTEKRRWFGGHQREGMQSIHSVWWAAECYHKASTLILSMKQQVSREKEGAMGKTGSTERQKKKGVLNLRILKR